MVKPWFYVDSSSEEEARDKVEADEYTVDRVETVGRLAGSYSASAGFTPGPYRFRVYVSEGRGV